MTRNEKLENITRILHQLLRALPAIREQGSREMLEKQLRLIAYFQARYDELVGAQTPQPA